MIDLVPLICLLFVYLVIRLRKLSELAKSKVSLISWALMSNWQIINFDFSWLSQFMSTMNIYLTENLLWYKNIGNFFIHIGIVQKRRWIEEDSKLEFIFRHMSYFDFYIENHLPYVYKFLHVLIFAKLNPSKQQILWEFMYSGVSLIFLIFSNQ